MPKAVATPPQFRSGEMVGLEEVHALISCPPETGGSISFTALLDLPPVQAVDIIVNEDFPAKHPPPPQPISPSSMFSVFASAQNSPESNAIFPASRPIKIDAVKQSLMSGKRKEREKKARREKINARMKLLQELVPGCNKISGTAMMLDEIINHVQALQHQVEFLSMRLAAVNPRIDFHLDALLAAESGMSIDNGYMGVFNPSILSEEQINGCADNHNISSWFRAMSLSSMSGPKKKTNLIS